MSTAIRVHALPDELLDRLRATGVDDLGNAVERLTAAGGEPVRCCLRDADAGEPLFLFGYQPPLPTSPYRDTGAVYSHADPCAGPARHDAYPASWRGRPQVLRAYDDRGWIHDALVHDGHDPEAEIAELLAEPAVMVVHSRNVAHGCFMFSITPDRQTA